MTVYVGLDPTGKLHAQPLDATIVFVHNDRLVNPAILDHSGESHQRHGVQLLQGNDSAPPGPYAQWMPYQVGQARRG